MSLGDAGKKRREQIKSLRSKRTALLNARDLSMKGRLDAQEQAQKEKVIPTWNGKSKKRTFIVTIYER